MIERFQVINSLIQDGQLAQALTALAEIPLTSTVDSRMHGHLKAIVLLRQGHAQEARRLFENTLQLYGENISLLRDLACCYHEIHEMHLFRATQSRLEYVMKEHGSQLSFLSRFNAQMMVAKFREEGGQVAAAIHSYRQLLDLSTRHSNKGLREMVLAQLVRAQALYEPVSPLSAYYSELITIMSEEYSFEVNIEVEHSLMLAELILVGPEHAWVRVEKLFHRPELVSADRRLLYYDFLESCLAYGYKIPATAQQYGGNFTDRDLYEHYIHILAFKGVAEISLVELGTLAPRLPWSSYVRILCVVANLQGDSFQRMELQRKILILLGSLDEESQKLWKRRLKEVLRHPETRLEFSALRRALYHGGSAIDLSRKKGMLQLLEKLSQAHVIGVDEAIHILWQSGFSPEHYHRLRMVVHRLNRLVHEFTSLGKIIEVDSESVRLKPGIRLVSQELSGEIAQNLSS